MGGKPTPAKRRFWLSWEEPFDRHRDYRPNGIWPVPREVQRYWCSGEGSSFFTMCAVVDAESEQSAKKSIGKSWPKHGAWRFCEEKEPCWRPGGRFPWDPEEPEVER